jgi:transcriptional regulator with XRE-family HTH domain
MNTTMRREQSDFGTRLRAIRKERGFSAQELARRAGLHAMAIVKLERGERQPVWPTVLKLCQALAVTCEAFVEPPPTPKRKKK